MSAKKIIAIVLSVVLLGVSAFSIAWGVINFNKVKDGLSGTGLYTQDDIQTAYEDGYGTALDNKQEYEDLIAEYRDKLSDYEIIKKELAVSKDNINELNEKVYNLQTYVAECEALIDKMKAENYQLKNQITHLETINANLMQSVNAYIQLISSMSIIEERFVVTFMFDDTVYSILLVPDGDKVQIENPKSTEYTIFLGWSLSLDGELVDLNEIEITADTVIYAKIIRKYDVNFILDYEVYEHHIVEKGDTITAKTPSSTLKRVFKGWSLDGVNVINVTNYKITEHRTFFAVVETRHEVKFVYTKHTPYQYTTILSTQYIGKSDTIRVPTPPTINGYNFSTWLINGDATKTISNPATYTPTGDTVFVAKYVARYISFASSVRVSTNKMVGQYSIFNYLSNNGHGYVTNLLQLKNFAITVRVYAGRMNGATYTLTNSNMYMSRIACDTLNETLTKGTVYFSIGLMANGYVHMQFTFEGSSLLNTSIFNGSFEILNMSFTMDEL